MAFLIYDRLGGQNGGVLRATSRSFSLAGYNLIYEAWERRASPVDTGWHVSADELIRLNSEGAESYETNRLVIDFHPSATGRIGLVELLDIYAYTWGDGAGGPAWTPLMLRLRDLFYEEYDPPIDRETKARIVAELKEPRSDAPDFIEFLYLNGPDYGWNWGRNGMTNAAFLQREARDYFRDFF